MQATMRCQAPSSARAARIGSPVLSPVLLRTPAFQGSNLKQSSQAQRLSVRSAAKADVADERMKLTGDEQDAEKLKVPKGYHWYETMMILKPTLSNEERDKELAKFEAFLNKEECQNINALVRGRSRMAYPIKSNWEGIYVLYTYAARRQTARTIQLQLSNPEAGSEDNLLRHISFMRL